MQNSFTPFPVDFFLLHTWNFKKKITVRNCHYCLRFSFMIKTAFERESVEQDELSYYMKSLLILTVYKKWGLILKSIAHFILKIVRVQQNPVSFLLLLSVVAGSTKIGKNDLFPSRFYLLIVRSFCPSLVKIQDGLWI